jgi:hypothetical protein
VAEVARAAAAKSVDVNEDSFHVPTRMGVNGSAALTTIFFYQLAPEKVEPAAI